jgi:hypothetical protein
MDGKINATFSKQEKNDQEISLEIVSPTQQVKKRDTNLKLKHDLHALYELSSSLSLGQEPN